VPKLTYEQMDYEPMEMGSYKAVFTRFEEDEMEHGPVFKLYFKIANDEPHEGKELSRLVSQKFNPKSNLFQTVQGLLGRPIRPGEEIDLDDLLGRPCVLNIGHNVKERGTFKQIDGVNPARKRKLKPRPELGEEGQLEDELEAAPF
jgi:rubrerythrin